MNWGTEIYTSALVNSVIFEYVVTGEYSCP